MTTNELLREFIDWNNSLEPQRKRIGLARGNIFLKNHRPEFKNLDIPLVVFSEERAEVCPYCGSEGTIKNDRKHKLCTNCSKGWQT